MIKPALPVFVLLAAAACSKPPTQVAAERGSAAGAPRANPTAPVAKIGNEVITAGELEKEARPEVNKLEAKAAEQLWGARAQTLDRIIEQRILGAKAKAENTTPEKIIEREVAAKVATPPEPEVRAAYDQMVAQGRPLPPFDQVKNDLANYLKERKVEQARKSYVDKLRADNKVQVMLPPLLLPKVEVAADGPTLGDQQAPITIVVFSDFQCPFCGRAEDTVKKVLDSYKGKVRLVFRDYPLPFHDKAQKASEAAHCAGDQGKYWQMHDKLFANQSALSVIELKGHAKGLGLDAARFDKCLDSGEKAKLVEASKKAGDEAGVNGTPAFFINGRPLSGAREFQEFKSIIDYQLAGGG
jgi:protein-disulfide isomerase